MSDLRRRQFITLTETRDTRIHYYPPVNVDFLLNGLATYKQRRMIRHLRARRTNARRLGEMDFDLQLVHRHPVLDGASPAAISSSLASACAPSSSPPSWAPCAISSPRSFSPSSRPP